MNQILKICAIVVAIFAAIGAIEDFKTHNHDAVHWAILCCIWCVIAATGVIEK